MLKRNSLSRLFDIVISFLILNFLFFKLIYFIFSTLKKSKRQMKETNRLTFYLKGLERSIQQYYSILKSNFILKIQCTINKQKLGVTLKTKLLEDNLYIYLLRNYIYKIIEEIIKEYNLQELIKDEILKVPITTFSEFLELYFELAEEITALSKKGRNFRLFLEK